MTRIKILFVVHESKETGAPLLLLHLLKEIKKFNGIDISILISKTGTLDKQFSSLGKCYFFNPKYLLKMDSVSRVLRKILPKKLALGIYRRQLYKTLVNQDIEIIYFNSLGSHTMFPFLRDYGSKIVTHIHELKQVVSSMNRTVVQDMVDSSDSVVSSYRTVTNFIRTYFSISENRLVENNVYLFHARKFAIDKLKENLKTNEIQEKTKTFKIGGCGSVEHRKGTDIFVDFAIKMYQKHPSKHIEFIWIGDSNTALGKELNYKIENMGLEHKIRFVGVTDTPEKFFIELDLFFLSSREEAFGLVGLENAYCETPLISFDIEGDLPLFIRNFQCGKVIPRYDFVDFEFFVTQLMADSHLQNELGVNAKAGVVSNFSLEEQALVIYNLLIGLQ